MGSAGNAWPALVAVERRDLVIDSAPLIFEHQQQLLVWVDDPIEPCTRKIGTFLSLSPSSVASSPRCRAIRRTLGNELADFRRPQSKLAIPEPKSSEYRFNRLAIVDRRPNLFAMDWR
ncbi:hypothetical protein ACVWZ6_001711 [Bradyrhizobium sp. GM6.1]